MPVSLSPTTALPAFPPVPRTVEWEMFSVIGESRSPFSLQKQVYDWGGRILRASLTYQPMHDTEARALLGFLASCHGVLGTFVFGDPVHTDPTNGGATAGHVSGPNQTGSTLVTTSTGLMPGDWIQLGVRMYMVTSESSGTLGIFPTIREIPADGEALTIHSCKGLFRLKSNVSRYGVDAMKVYGVSFEIEEAL